MRNDIAAVGLPVLFNDTVILLGEYVPFAANDMALFLPPAKLKAYEAPVPACAFFDV